MAKPSSTFVLSLVLPKSVRIETRSLDRDDFFAWLWQEFAERGLVGVHEGTLLSEQAAEQGLETEAYTVDAAQAPRERDWIGAQGESHAEAYFASEAEARAAQKELQELLGTECVGSVTEQKPQDWDAEWKKSFLNAAEGLFIHPFWRILPAWVAPDGRASQGEELASGARVLPPSERPLLINPGAGFGTGTHETTQLCLQAVGEFARGHLGGSRASRPERSLSGVRALDFGSGSGILAIGAALLGAQVDAVEIDELAIDNARENARLNGVEAAITYSRELGGVGERYPLVIANILRPVLIQFAPELVKRLAPGGVLVLSGLVASDVPEIQVVYSGLLGGARPVVYERGEWRAVVWESYALSPRRSEL